MSRRLFRASFFCFRTTRIGPTADRKTGRRSVSQPWANGEEWRMGKGNNSVQRQSRERVERPQQSCRASAGAEEWSHSLARSLVREGPQNTACSLAVTSLTGRESADGPFSSAKITKFSHSIAISSGYALLVLPDAPRRCSCCCCTAPARQCELEMRIQCGN